MADRVIRRHVSHGPVTNAEFSWLIQNSKLRGSDERIYRVLLHFQNRDFLSAPKMVTMVRMTKFDRSTIQRRLRSMQTRGYIKHVGWSKKYGSRSYRLLWERLCDDAEQSAFRPK